MTPREAAAPVGRETPRTLRFKQADVSRAILGAEQAGLTIASSEIDENGRIILFVDNSKPQEADKGFVYVLRCLEYVKVGLSRDVEQRRRTLQTAVPFEITTVFKLGMLLFETLGVEAAAHAELMPYHVRNEWFSCSVDQAIAAVEKAAAKLAGTS